MPCSNDKESTMMLHADINALYPSFPQFSLKHADTPLSLAEHLDVRAFYAKARLGQLENSTCIDSRYELFEISKIHIDTIKMSIDKATKKIVKRSIGK